MPLEMNMYTDGSALVVSLAGHLDASNAPATQRDILALLSDKQCKIVMDMDKLEFLSSAGMRMILGVLREARTLGGDVRLARLRPNVQEVIQMGFANMLKTFGSLPGALSSFEPEREQLTGIISIAKLKLKWVDPFLNKMRQVGDPPADAAVQALFEQEQIQAVNKLMIDLVSNDFIPPSDLPPVIQNYLATTIDLPSWADWTRIRRGQELFGQHGMQMIMVLFCGSLPMSYAARKGVRVLGMTQRLNRSPYRRVLETAQMLLDVMTPGGLERGGVGLRSAQKVRLMHAAIRHLLLASGHWDSAEYDYPINQEDLAGTLMAFSHAMTVGLPLLGVDLTREQAEDYLHTWKVIGHVMGILPEMLPEDIEDAKMLAERISRRHVAFSEEGREMTANLIRMLQETIPGGHFHAIPQALIRHLVGDEIADLLGVERTPWQLALGPLQWANRLLDQSQDTIPLIGKVTGVFSQKILERLMIHNLGGQRAPFRIPENLAQDWQLTIGGSDVSIEEVEPDLHKRENS
jgi:anti-anti-sigma factor